MRDHTRRSDHPDDSVAEQLRTRRRRRRQAALGGLIVAAALGVLAWWLVRGPSEPDPRDAAEALALAWSAGGPQEGPVTDPDGVAAAYPPMVQSMERPPAVEVADVERTGDGEDPVARFTVTWDLGGDQELSYPTAAALREVDGEWRVVFSPATVHPRLVDGGRLVRRRVVPARADIIGAGGSRLVTGRPVVHVGVEPGRVQDVDALTTALAQLLEVDGSRLAEAIEAAPDDAFVPVLTLRAHAYEELRDQLHPLPGTVFREGELPLAPTRDFARPVLGAAGEVTAEVVEEHPDRYEAGDVAGLSGLQRRYDERLAGRPGVEVVVVGADGAEQEVLHRREPEPGVPLQLTLDERVQSAAEEALASVEHPSALVAIRVSDGHVLAAANGPGNVGREIALTGQLPPGSTLKVVTTAALLEGGLDPDAPVGCPPTATVDGRSFRNAEEGALGEVPFGDAFAHSCNTAFVTLSTQLDDDALKRWGQRFGVGHSGDLGVGAYRGDLPVNDSPVDKAAASIGQARNLVSPLVLADMAATVARGRHLSPIFVLDPEAAPTEPPAEPLDPTIASTLQRLMRSVVTQGSGTAVAGVPGDPVHGKTGTAEYGTEQPPRTHAWFIAYQGDIALSVVVAETADGFGGRLAAPIAADFLGRLRAAG
jgi:cell division protein FtsI/penicillin-binding protein 2